MVVRTWDMSVGSEFAEFVFDSDYEILEQWMRKPYSNKNKELRYDTTKLKGAYCKACINTYYCNKSCQKRHWKIYKYECNIRVGNIYFMR